MKKLFIVMAWLAVVVLAFHFRTAGLYRGLSEESIYHPDEPKQVVALWRFLHNHYVWHIGNVFYDGYPYGLNHVDEYILRPYLLSKEIVSKHFAGTTGQDAMPAKEGLFYVARSLRVLYGMFCLLIGWLISRRLSFSQPASWFLLLLMAMAPISIAVSHFATGDIGTDLFAGLAVLFLCIYAEKNRGIWLFVTGLAVGMAFACKYNGILCGASAGVYLVLRLCLTREWKKFLCSCFVLCFGVLVGIVWLTPTLILDSRRAIKDILANFAFIQEYGANDDYFQKTFLEKVAYVLTVNLPRVIRQMGWYVVLTAFLSALVTGIRSIRAIRKHVIVEDANRDVLVFSVIVYPFIALLLSLSGKPEVQPFHFSYLQLPLIIGAVYGIGWLSHNVYGRPARVVVAILMVVMLAETGVKAEKDFFFWAKQDNSFLCKEMEWTVFSASTKNDGALDFVKDIFLEPENAAVFRNSKKKVDLHGGAFWRALHIAPVPSIPWPGELDWIYVNGPVFPRNDRMFKVSRDSSVTKYIVFHDKPGVVTVGVRSGSWPVETSWDVGGVKKKLILQPDYQELLTVSPEKWRVVDERGEFGRDVFIVPLTISASVGDAYVTVCANASDVGAFLLFGGESERDVFEMPVGMDRERIISEVARTKYLESTMQEGILLDSSDAVASSCILPRREGDNPVNFPLPCGAFKLECEVVTSSDDAEVEMCVGDFRIVDSAPQCVKKQIVSKGQQVLTYSFTKTFSPYQCCVSIRCLRGKIRIDSWKLVPDTEVVLENIQEWKQTGSKPEWLNRCRPARLLATQEDFNKELCFGGAIDLNSFSMPAKLVAGEPVEVFCDMELKKFPFADLGEYFAFVHLLDRDGRQVYATGFPITVAFKDCNSAIQCEDVPGNIASGEYTVVLGVWNSRTGKRMSVSGENISKKEKKKEYIRVGTTTF